MVKMLNEQDHADALIALFLSGQAGPDEALRLEMWMEAHEDNRLYYIEMENAYALTHDISIFEMPDIEKAWKNTSAGLKDDTRIVPLWNNRRFYISAAAIAIVMFTIGALFNHFTTKTNKIGSPLISKNHFDFPQDNIFVASDQIRKVTLADNSKVSLEPGSVLTLHNDFNKNGRHLSLKGNATFEVVHDVSKPFIVDVEGLKVIDVGTVFTIETMADTVKVVVSDGAVELSINNNTLNIIEGDSAFYIISKEVIKRYPSPEERKGKTFVFEGTELKDVALILSEFFGRKIVVMDDAIAKCRLSVTFKNEELPTILDIIKELLDVKIIQNEEIIGIYGEGCQ